MDERPRIETIGVPQDPPQTTGRGDLAAAGYVAGKPGGRRSAPPWFPGGFLVMLAVLAPLALAQRRWLLAAAGVVLLAWPVARRWRRGREARVLASLEAQGRRRLLLRRTRHVPDAALSPARLAADDDRGVSVTVRRD